MASCNTTVLWGKHYPHFTDAKSGAQTDQVTCPSSHGWQTAEPKFEHGSAFPKVGDLSTVLYHPYQVIHTDCGMGVQTAAERRRRRDFPRHWPRVVWTINLCIYHTVGAQYSYGEGWKVRAAVEVQNATPIQGIFWKGAAKTHYSPLAQSLRVSALEYSCRGGRGKCSGCEEKELTPMSRGTGWGSLQGPEKRPGMHFWKRQRGEGRGRRL